MKKTSNLLTKILDELKSLFLGGLFTLLPIALTIAFFTFTYSLLKSWFNPIYLITPQCLKVIPGSEFFIVLITVFIVGAVLKFLLLHPLIESLEHYFVKRLPLIRTVYFGIKQLVRALNPKDTEHFQKVVLIEFPRPGLYSLGFLTSKVPPKLSPCDIKDSSCKTFYSIFLPNTPNPTTGFYVIAAEEDFKTTELTRQEAMTIIISGGIIQPERLMHE